MSTIQPTNPLSQAFGAQSAAIQARIRDAQESDRNPPATNSSSSRQGQLLAQIRKALSDNTAALASLGSESDSGSDSGQGASADALSALADRGLDAPAQSSKGIQKYSSSASSPGAGDSIEALAAELQTQLKNGKPDAGTLKSLGARIKAASSQISQNGGLFDQRA